MSSILLPKLGITPQTSVQVLGPVDDEELDKALRQAARISATEGDMIVARVDTPETLTAFLHAAYDQLSQGVPIWFVYPKGPGHSLSESSVFSIVRARNMTDTKVAAVSSRLTALRFVRRKN